MKLRTRFLLLLAMLCLVFACMLGFMTVSQKEEAEDVLASLQMERSLLFDRIISQTGKDLKQYAYDYSYWDEMIAFSRTRDPRWAHANIETSIGSFGVQAAWVLDTSCHTLYGFQTIGQQGLETPPIPSGELQTLVAYSPFAHLHVWTGAGLLEMRIAPLQPSEDWERSSPPQGYLAVARLWDDVHLNLISSLTEGKVTLTRKGGEGAPAASSITKAPGDGAILIQKDVSDWRGIPAATLELRYRPPVIDAITRSNTLELTCFITLICLAMLMIVIVLNQWVIIPVGRIINRLDSTSGETSSPLPVAMDEFTRLSLLVEQHVRQKRELREAIAEQQRAAAYASRSQTLLLKSMQEKIQLGRDLHDGVIQSLFATGLNLEAALRARGGGQEPGDEPIRSAIAALNATIREIRSHIAGLQPGGLQQSSFVESLDSLAASFREANPVDFDIEVDPEASALLSPEQLFECLQICREAATNAVRHARPSTIAVRLSRSGGGVLLEITDNGSGFDPAKAAPGGRGLANMRGRATALGGQLEILAGPGGSGTTVRLAFNPPGAG